MIHPLIHNDVIWLTRKDTAVLLQTVPHTLAVWHSTKRYNLPCTRLRGKQIYYRLQDIEQHFATWDVIGYDDYIKYRRDELFKGIPKIQFQRKERTYPWFNGV